MAQEQGASASFTAFTADLHRGHVEWEKNHMSIQSMWKRCPHRGRHRTFSPSSNSFRHTAHSPNSSSPPSSPIPEKRSTGRDARISGSSWRCTDEGAGVVHHRKDPTMPKAVSARGTADDEPSNIDVEEEKEDDDGEEHHNRAHHDLTVDCIAPRLDSST
ncbi:hypothetical protein HPP92_003119 [Vanilla planifolia]|uniref:Uncharacterized protein n=1 Tax=Vanilla planifolia TaxID=51239 RepID=A0A835VIL2_VANPL|nr:hypothetical protein HPP92_003119 [Vanilla planifolia]